MTIGEKLATGINTTLIGMGIVFMVLIILFLIIKLESYLLKNLNAQKNTETTPQDVKVAEEQKPEMNQVFKKGVASGTVTIEGIDSDEELAAIMASVSFDAEIPLNQLRIKQIKLIEK